MATIEERFQAAVNVIKGLPKNGPYQPSTAMMLKFYGYYKQATEGPCHQKRPAFWDVVGKAKWDAWNDNRHLNKQQAMERYVDSLREIIETMSFTENVQNFVGSISGLDNINLDELDMVAPGMRELAESHPNSPFNSRTNSPQHGATANGVTGGSVDGEELNDELHAVPSTNGLATPHLNGLSNDSAADISAPIAVVPRTPVQEVMAPLNTYAMSNGTVEQSDEEYGDPVDMQHDITEAMIQNSELLKQIQATVLRMNADLVTMNQRISVLDKTLHEVRKVRSGTAVGGSRSVAARAFPSWWPFEDISPAWFALLVLWPFLLGRLSRVFAPRRK